MRPTSAGRSGGPAPISPPARSAVARTPLARDSGERWISDASTRDVRMRSRAGRLPVSQALGIDVDDERGEQDQAADEDLEEAVDLDVIKAVIENAEHQEADDRVADAAAPAEEAGAADHHRRNRVEQEGVELVLLGRAEI